MFKLLLGGMEVSVMCGGGILCSQSIASDWMGS